MKRRLLDVIINNIGDAMYGNPMKDKNQINSEDSRASKSEVNNDNQQIYSSHQTLYSVFPTAEIYKEARKYF